MKRDFRRQRRLTPFKCDLATLESFMGRLSLQFPKGEARVEFSVDLPEQQIEAYSITELREAEDLPSTITKVQIVMYGDSAEGEYYLNIGEPGSFSRPSAKATGPTAAWCAGVVEEVRDFAKRNRSWYWFLRSWMFYVVFFLIGPVLQWGGPHPSTATLAVGIGALVVFLFLSVSFDRYFPTITIRLRERSQMRDRGPALSFAGGVLALVAVLLGLLTKNCGSP